MKFFRERFNSGQSLVEVLVAISLATIFVVGAATIIAPSLQIGKQTSQSQTKGELANEMLGNVTAWSEANWNNVLALATGTTHTYYLNTSSSPFTASTSSLGMEQIMISSTTYNRYFYLSDVYRDSNGNIATVTGGNNYDPSTKLATIVVNTSSSNPGLGVAVSVYLTRSRSNVFNQTTWSGGSGQSNPVTLASSTFASSNNVTVTASGSIQLSPGGGSCLL